MATSVPDTSVPPKMSTLGKARSCCFTINNYTTEEVESLRKYATQCKYLVFGYEVAPQTGTPHLQGYVAWDNPRSLKAFQNCISTKRFHIEKTRGTAKEASDYCKYEDYPENNKPNKIEEFGTLPKQGERTDWSKASEEIAEGKEIVEVIQEQPQLMPCIRALERFKTLMLKPKMRPNLRVIVLWGDAGTGKSRWAWDNFPDLYSKPTGDWWDGYTGQDTILLDDYYGGIQYSEFLKVLDIYPYQVPVKGSFVHAQWTTVIITSNKPPEQWYNKGMTPALKRRLHEIYDISIDGIPKTQIRRSDAPSPQADA